MSVRSFTLLFVGNPSLELTQEVIVIINRSQRELFITGRNHTVSVNSVKNMLYYFINRAGEIMSGIWRIGSIVLGYYCAINGQSKTLAFFKYVWCRLRWSFFMNNKLDAANMQT